MNSLLKKALTIVLSITMLLSTLTFGSATVAVAEGYVEKPIEATEDYTGLTETDGVYRVGTEAEWAALVAKGIDFAGKTVVLTDNITFTAANGTLATFAGTLDGNGFTLKGVTNPLIDTLNGGATIQNLIVEDAVVTLSETNSSSWVSSKKTYRAIGVIANVVNVTGEIAISSVAVKNVALTSDQLSGVTATYTGGIVAYIAKASNSPEFSFENCTVSGEVIGKTHTGGFIGAAASGLAFTLTMNNCQNAADLSIKDNKQEGANIYLGGMASYIGKTTVVTITDCENTGNFEYKGALSKSTHAWAGGLIARIRNALTMQNCRNSGSMTINASTAAGNVIIGGVVGQMGDGTVVSELSSCVNTGDLKNETGSFGNNIMGGIVGLSQHDATITGCVNYGEVFAGNTTRTSGVSLADAGAAGILGTFTSKTLVTISNCYNMGAVYAADVPAGGIVAKSSKTIALTGCVNTADVYSCVDLDNNNYLVQTPEARHIAGGIVAGSYDNAATGSTLTGCINTGKVMGAYSAGGILGSVQHTATYALTGCSNSGNVTSAQVAGGIIGDTAAAVTVSACYATGDYISTGANLGAIAGNAANVTVADSYASVTLNDAYTAWEGAAVSTKKEAEMLSELAVLNIDAQKSAVVDGKFDVVVLAAMNNLTGLTKVGFDVIRVVDGQANKLAPESTMVYTDVYGYDADGAQKVVNATDYANTSYLSALKITNVDTTENVTYLYRAFAVRMVEGEEVVVYGTWNAVSFAAAEA